MQTQELKELDLASLAEIDGGRLNLAFMHELDRVLADLDDRPGETKAREISLKIGFVPVMDGTVCDSAKVQAVVCSNVPKRTSKVYDMNLRKRSGKVKLMFRPDSLEDADQTTIDFEELHERESHR